VTPTIVYQINRFLRGSMPFALTLLLALLSVVPTGISGFAIVTPSFVSISVFYWSIHRPYLMSAPVVFLIGVFSDFLTGAPLGLTSLMLLAVHGIALSQRRVFLGKAFILTWWGYLLAAFAIAVASWLVSSLYFLALVPLTPIMTQFVLTLFVFPVCAWGFGLLQNNLLRLT
jgi:rod shape-determining protein MreD